MDLSWKREPTPRWDADKARLIGGAPAGTLPEKQRQHADGALLSGDWWRVEVDDVVAGYGWMDTSWGDAEVLLVLSPEHQSQGLGSFILSRLEVEAKQRGVNYLYNTIPEGHPDEAGLREWLVRRGFHASEDGRTLRASIRTSR